MLFGSFEAGLMRAKLIKHHAKWRCGSGAARFAATQTTTKITGISLEGILNTPSRGALVAVEKKSELSK